MTQTPGSSPENNDLEERNLSAEEQGGEGSQGPDAKPDDSSTSEVAKEPKSMLEAVKAVVAEDKGAASTTVKPGESGAQKPGVAAAAKDGAAAKPGEAAVPDEQLPFHTHPRFRQLLKESNEGKEIKRQFDLIAPEAQEARDVRQFMVANDLAPAEVAEGFKIMALLKSDPVAAYELLMERVEGLQTLIGEKLPADLQAKVNDGTLDEAAAKEVARSRFSTAHAARMSQMTTQRAQQTVQQTAEQRQQEESQRNMLDQQAGVIEWEEGIKKTDPDYGKKEQFIIAETANLSRLNPPKNRADAVALVQQAYKNVNANVARMLPARRTVAPVPGGSPSSADKPQPKTMKEAVRMAAAGEIT